MTAFCVTIVKNSSIDMIRRSKKYAHLESLDYLKDESVEKFEDIYINKANIQRLSELIDELSQEERELIQLRYAQDMGYAEIGALLDITEEAAKKRGQRVVKKLKKLFGEG
jgi:RNA polymerase sigma-70 factor (ECF subfamily)